MDRHLLSQVLGTSAETYRWVPLSALKAGEYLSCIDGRHEECIVAAPGGDLGEFVVMLSSIEAITGTELGREQVDACLAEVMEWHSRFYMHTDQIALGELSKTLCADERFASERNLDDLDHLATFIRHPRIGFRSALCPYLVNPDFTGCGHLRLMLENPGAYEIRRGLVEDSILAFYERMWNGSPSTNFVVLSGVHQERAILVIKMKEKPTGATFVPAIRGGALGDSMAFVVHEPARHWLRGENLRLLTGAAAIDPGIDVQSVETEMDRRGAIHLTRTSEKLARGLPVFELEFDAQTHELQVHKL